LQTRAGLDGNPFTLAKPKNSLSREAVHSLDMTIRLARCADVDEISDLVTAGPKTSECQIQEQQKIKPAILRRLADCQKHGSFWVAEIDSRIIGLVHLQLLFSLVIGDRIALIETIAVAAAWRGKGIDKSLLSHAEGWAIQRGARQLQLWIPSKGASSFHAIDDDYWQKEERMSVYRRLLNSKSYLHKQHSKKMPPA
jgi:N-acetylglutamate synthase-like GNAT family acetyltransferase